MIYISGEFSISLELINHKPEETHFRLAQDPCCIGLDFLLKELEPSEWRDIATELKSRRLVTSTL